LATGANYQIKISNATNTAITDFSDNFTITETPYINITSPNATTSWKIGTSQTITWNDNLAEPVKIELLKAGSIHTVVSESTSSNGTFQYLVPNTLPVASNYSIKITSTANAAISSTSPNFSITDIPVITVTSPTVASTWQAGSNQSITWTANFSETLTIDLYRGGVFLQNISAGVARSQTPSRGLTSNSTYTSGVARSQTPSRGLTSNSTYTSGVARSQTPSRGLTSNSTYEWTLPATLTAASNYQNKISKADETSVNDFSDNFTITEIPVITLTQPTAASNWVVGSTQSITWTDNISEPVKIDLYQNNSHVQNISNSTSANSYNWTLPTSLTAASNYVVRITSTANSNIMGNSAPFSITTNCITVQEPNATSVWKMNSTHLITWSDAISDPVKIELYKAGVWAKTIINTTPSNGTYLWLVPTTINAGNDYTVKITSTTSGACNGTSAQFAIAAADFIAITAPTAGTYWDAGTTHTIVDRQFDRATYRRTIQRHATNTNHCRQYHSKQHYLEHTCYTCHSKHLQNTHYRHC